MVRDQNTIVGQLHVVATPIGNMEDITLRALNTLRKVDVILAEDTRRTGILLRHHGIQAVLRSYHAHSSPQVLDTLVEQLSSGKNLALVTDAGTPSVSDPGHALVDRCLTEGIAVTPIPGASALTSAVSVCGFRPAPIRFMGFFPRATGDQSRWISQAKGCPELIVFFESPHRIQKTLGALNGGLGNHRRVTLCRELTKIHEQVTRGTLTQVSTTLSDMNAFRGEFVVVLEPDPQDTTTEVDKAAMLQRVQALVEKGISAKDGSAALSEELGVPKRQVYQLWINRDTT